MASLTVSVDGVEQTARFFDTAAEKVTRANVRAVNRAIQSARTLMVRNIAQDIGLKSKDVRDALPLREATFNHPTASFAASLKRIPLIDFRARGPQPSRGRGRGVTYRIGKSQKTRPHAFIARMSSGHVGVFARSGKKRLPIHELHGPSLGRVFAKHRSSAIARAQEQYRKNIGHELAFAGVTNAA